MRSVELGQNDVRLKEEEKIGVECGNRRRRAVQLLRQNSRSVLLVFLSSLKSVVVSANLRGVVTGNVVVGRRG